MKAEKIARILQKHRSLRGSRILDVGAGSGITASLLAELAGPEGGVWAADVRDSRIRSQGFQFVVVKDVHLPFDTDFFDVVVSNHVIEHVGSRAEQVLHLSEVMRVLRPDGVAYLATPNRWTIVEPHFHLPFLSWVPVRLRDPYVRLAHRGQAYDCELLSRSQLREMLTQRGGAHRDETAEAMRLTAEIEGPLLLARGLRLAPSWALRLLARVSPTFVFTVRKTR